MIDLSLLKNSLDDVEGVNLFRVHEIDRASDQVGLYAWYAQPDIGKSDWGYKIEDGEDIGVRRFRGLLDRHTTRFRSPPLSVTARTYFSQSYEGKLKDCSYKSLEALTEDAEPESSVLYEMVQSPDLRGLAVSLIRASSALFHAPLYVGVAESLDERLSSHVSQLNRFYEAVKDDSEKRDALLRTEKTTFASRAVGMGFTVDHLYVITLTSSKITDSQLDKDDIRIGSEAVEWLLNHWSRPILGRA